MSDHLSPIALERFRHIASELEKRSPGDWLRQYIQSYLSQLSLAARLQRLLEANAGAPIIEIFGDARISSRDFILSQGFTEELASFSEADQRKIEEMFPGLVRELLEATIAESISRARTEGETAAGAEHGLEKERLTKEVDRLQEEANLVQRRLRVVKSKITNSALFALLLVGCLGLTLWFARLVGPEATQVTIEYNVGEIIAGILGGAGAAAAGLGYAAKSLRGRDDEERTKG